MNCLSQAALYLSMEDILAKLKGMPAWKSRRCPKLLGMYFNVSIQIWIEGMDPIPVQIVRVLY